MPSSAAPVTCLAIIMILTMPLSSITATMPVMATADGNNKYLVERGRDWAKYHLDDGQIELVAGLPEWVYDQEVDAFVPHILEERHNLIAVESAKLSWKIHPHYSELFSPSLLSTPLALEKWVYIIGGQNHSANFVSQKVDTNSSGVFVTQIYSLEELSANVHLIYAIYDGLSAKRIVAIDGLPAGHNVKLQRIWELQFENATLEVSEGLAKVGRNGKTVLTEVLGTAGDRFQGVTLYGSNAAVFEYSGWSSLDSSILLIDDTFASSDPAEDGHLQTTVASGTNCPATVQSRANSLTVMVPGIDASSNANGKCIRAYGQWDIEIIPAYSKITNATLTIQVVAVTNGRNCDFVEMDTVPNQADDASVWADIGNGTVYSSNNNACASGGSNKVIKLGTSAMADIRDARIAGDQYFSVGIRLTNETRSTSIAHAAQIASEENGSATPKPTLTITYTPSVTVDITLNARSGTTVPETLGKSFVIGGCGPSTHDGSPATVTFTCFQDTDITIVVPGDTATYRYRWDNQNSSITSIKFHSCVSGTCSPETFEYYRQIAQAFKANEVPGNELVPATRKNLGVDYVEGFTGGANITMFADEGSSFNIYQTRNATTLNPPEKYDGSIAYVALAFDRVFDSAFNMIKANMTQKGFKGSLFVTTDTADAAVDNAGWYDINVLRVHGWEVVSHGKTHTAYNSGTSQSTLNTEIAGSKATIESRGLCTVGFFPPDGSNQTSAALNTIRASVYSWTGLDYQSGSSHYAQNTASSLQTNRDDNYNLDIVYIKRVGNGYTEVSYNDVKDEIDTAVSSDNFLILAFGQIENSAASDAIAPATFNQILDYLKTKSDAGEIRVTTIGQALGYDCDTVDDRERYKSYDHVGDYVVSAPESYELDYNHERQVENFLFKTNDDKSLVTLTMPFKITSENGTISSVYTTQDVWVTDGTATLTDLVWNGKDVTPTSPNNVLNITTGSNRMVNIAIGSTLIIHLDSPQYVQELTIWPRTPEKMPLKADVYFAESLDDWGTVAGTITLDWEGGQSLTYDFSSRVLANYVVLVAKEWGDASVIANDWGYVYQWEVQDVAVNSATPDMAEAVRNTQLQVFMVLNMAIMGVLILVVSKWDGGG